MEGVFNFWPMLGRFFQVFSDVRCLAYRGNDFIIGLSTLKVIGELLVLKYNQNSTLLQKFVPVVQLFLG